MQRDYDPFMDPWRLLVSVPCRDGTCLRSALIAMLVVASGSCVYLPRIVPAEPSHVLPADRDGRIASMLGHEEPSAQHGRAAVA